MGNAAATDVEKDNIYQIGVMKITPNIGLGSATHQKVPCGLRILYGPGQNTGNIIIDVNSRTGHDGTNYMSV